MKLRAKRDRRHVKGVTLFLSLLAAVVLCGWLLRNVPDGVFYQIEQIAAWFQGGAKPEVVTWPAWGYAGLLTMIPSHAVILVLQSLLGTMALTMLVMRLAVLMPGQARLLVVLALLALPWHVLLVSLYPTALAGTAILLAILCLERALERNSGGWAMAAGVSAGLGQNFRSEFLLLPVFLVTTGLILGRLRLRPLFPWRPAVLFAATALALQLPWAWFYRTETGRLSLTESNFGHVLYVSLGNDPKNPWGILNDDQAATDALRQAGHTCSSLSDEGSRVLLRIVGEKARQHPMSLVRRSWRQFCATMAAPFNWKEPAFGEADARDLDVLREDVKSRLGIAVNQRQLQDYRRRGVMERAWSNKRAVFSLGYQFGATATGCALFCAGLLGMLLVALRMSGMTASTLLFLLGCTVIYKFVQNVVLCYQVNYLSNVYPMLLPFAAVSITAVFSASRKIGRSRRGAERG